MTLPELLLWRDLRRGALQDLRFRRQHPVGSYIVDFYCPNAKLAIEIDGAAHDVADQVSSDRRRDGFLRSEHIRVLRFNARDILDDDSRQDVLSTIAAAAAPSPAFGGPPPPLRG